MRKFRNGLFFSKIGIFCVITMYSTFLFGEWSTNGDIDSTNSNILLQNGSIKMMPLKSIQWGGDDYTKYLWQIKDIGDPHQLQFSYNNGEKTPLAIRANGDAVFTGTVVLANPTGVSTLWKYPNNRFDIYPVGGIIADNPFWRGAHFAGPALNNNTSFPRLSIYQSSSTLNNPSDLKFYMSVGNLAGINHADFVLHTKSGNINLLPTISSDGSKGNVGIGTENPQAKLHVAGNAIIDGNLTAITYSCSDRRYKKGIAPLDNALSKLLSLNGVYFNWKREEYKAKYFSKERQIGFIAQDVEKIFPELVITDKDGYKAMSYDKLTAVLVEAVKELKKDNADLAARVDRLEKLAAAGAPHTSMKAGIFGASGIQGFSFILGMVFAGVVVLSGFIRRRR